MRRFVISSLLAATLSQPAFALQTFQCHGAAVTIGVDTTPPLRSTEGADVILRVDRGPRSTILRYSNVDFIGGGCDLDANQNARIVYQAVCGGSGCQDGSNWGVIDPETLQALLVPSKESLDSAIELLGHSPTLEAKLMSVSEEAHRLGLPTP